uniref:Uncharacterized protein n=1 Tax=Geospiza parvula TaxID=87175 RepID=A0A8C3MVN0_GEOPR
AAMQVTALLGHCCPGQGRAAPRGVEGGWCGGHKWNPSCHSSQSFTFNLGRFETKKGAKVCANPEEKWVKRAVKITGTQAKQNKGLILSFSWVGRGPAMGNRAGLPHM